ncbi:MAG: ABC transporter permease [Chloracidobacterium sp.]|uniref:ABC transporter permease n=1 Tax=Chloracidobacterium validum TaxID=2821543 RepID=A0ABX8B7S6_9BACT|nr:ABC transporter permease [Chloracidobacterium validum]QUW02734.1 ABC transporter permease [Chloracidobacterium validum]
MQADLRSVIALAILTFHEARKRKVLLLAFGLGLLFLALFAWGFGASISPLGAVTPVIQRAQCNTLTLAGLYVVNLLVVVTAVALPVDTLSGDIASGVVHTLLTKPLRRATIVLGKWVGFLFLLTLYLGFMAGGVLLVTWLTAGYTPPSAAAALLLMWLGGVAILTMTIAGGTRLPTLANGVVVLGLYGIAFIGGWMERIGATLGNPTARNLGIASSLLVPTEAMWQSAAALMQPILLSQIGMAPFSSSSPPSPLMIAWTVGCIVANLALAIWWFEQRDL